MDGEPRETTEKGRDSKAVSIGERTCHTVKVLVSFGQFSSATRKEWNTLLVHCEHRGLSEETANREEVRQGETVDVWPHAYY